MFTVPIESGITSDPSVSNDCYMLRHYNHFGLRQLTGDQLMSLCKNDSTVGNTFRDDQ